MDKLKLLNGWAGNEAYSTPRSAQGYSNANRSLFVNSGGVSACGSNDEKPKPSACGAGDDQPKPSSCGAGDDVKPKPSACGSSCGSGEK